MHALADIQQQIDALPHRYVFWTKKEIRALPEILQERERILALTSGLMDGRTWLAVCTDSRLIFLNRRMVFGSQQVQIPLDRVQSIEHDFMIAFGQIRVWDGASYFTLRMVLKSSIEPFVKATQEAVARYKRHLQQPAATPPAADLASQLERLAALKEKGHLTEEEFAAQKRRLLGG